MATPQTKVKVLGLKKVLSAIRKEIILELRSREMRDGISKIVIDAIRANPKPVTSDVTLKFREYYEQFNKTHPTYNRNEITATFTGQLLEDLRKNMRLRSEKNRGFSYVFEQSDKLHKGYKFKPVSRTETGSVSRYKTGKRKGEARRTKTTRTEQIAFSKISEYLVDKGYNYLDIDEETLTIAENFIQNRLSIRLRKFLKQGKA